MTNNDICRRNTEFVSGNCSSIIIEHHQQRRNTAFFQGNAKNGSMPQFSRFDQKSSNNIHSVSHIKDFNEKGNSHKMNNGIKSLTHIHVEQFVAPKQAQQSLISSKNAKSLSEITSVNDQVYSTAHTKHTKQLYEFSINKKLIFKGKYPKDNFIRDWKKV